ncbi:MAG: carbon-nitrogen hydrolase family protein [Pseudomonadota bacterium]
MDRLEVALLQITSSDDPAANLAVVEPMAREAAAGGARLIATPEVTNVVSMSRKRQRDVLRREADDPTLAALSALARELDVHLLIGSLALLSDPPETRFANRSFLIGPTGETIARYDKIHMFDADPSAGERYRESSGYRPGEAAVLARSPWGPIGMTICYDLRFPELYLRLARAGARILTIPSAFTRPTGAAHWEPLLRARAIETGAFVLAPAQCGVHEAAEGPARETWGRSLVVSPWGDVLADGGAEPGVVRASLDLSEAASARRKVPSLSGARVFSGP